MGGGAGAGRAPRGILKATRQAARQQAGRGAENAGPLAHGLAGESREVSALEMSELLGVGDIGNEDRIDHRHVTCEEHALSVSHLQRLSPRLSAHAEAGEIAHLLNAGGIVAVET